MRKLNQYVNYDARLKAMSEHPALLGVVSRLLGGAVPELFANQALLKPPLIGREKPWHQDHAFFNVPLGTPVVGVWIALDEALLENGCMHVIPAGHKEPIVHFKRRDWQICDDQVHAGGGPGGAPQAGGAALLRRPAARTGRPPPAPPAAGGRCSSTTSPTAPGASRRRSGWPSSGAKGRGVTC